MVCPSCVFHPTQGNDRQNPGNGRHQIGSKDAPLFWNLIMYLILHDLLAQYDKAWIIDHIVVFADDLHLRWLIQSLVDGFKAIHGLTFLLRVFGAYD